MRHPKRTFGVTRIDSINELAQVLTEQHHPLCAGFEHQEVFCLNDSISENGPQEYVIIYNGQQVESIILDWCTKERLEGYIHNLLAGYFVAIEPVWPIIELAEGHSCFFCR